MPLSVGKIAKTFGISRTTLLYYDTLGLLRPTARSKAGYRLYEDKDVERLRQIMLFRQAGVPLKDIVCMVGSNEISIASLLLRRLGELNNEIETVKKQQDIIVRILKSSRLYEEHSGVNRETWRDVLKDAGLNEVNAGKWHADFEKHSPEQHQNFLKLLGFSEQEIHGIRKR